MGSGSDWVKICFMVDKETNDKLMDIKSKLGMRNTSDIYRIAVQMGLMQLEMLVYNKVN